MAHELSIRANGRAEMAFVGQTPWHGLGQNVTKGASIGVWQKEAGMDWQAKEAPVSFRDGTTDMQVAYGYKMLYRSDSNDQLAIVGDKYEVVQPVQVLEFFREMCESLGWWIHTAGTMRGGRKLWAMATNGDSGKVGKGDEMMRNVVVATSLDGSMKTTAIETAVRVVCANTLRIALNGSGKKYVATSHRSVFDPDFIKSTLGLERDYFKVFIEQARNLADQPINLADAQAVLRDVFKVDAPSKIATLPNLAWLGDLSNLKDEVKPENRSVDRVLALFNGDAKGAGLKTAQGTKWGLLNALTEHVDHEMGRSDDTRLDSAWFGRGDVFKADALALLTA